MQTLIGAIYIDVVKMPESLGPMAQVNRDICPGRYQGTGGASMLFVLGFIEQLALL